MKVRIPGRAMLLAAALVGAPAAGGTDRAAACGAEAACAVSAAGIGRSYRIRLPEGGGAAPGALLFAHGYKGSAGPILGNDALAAAAARSGLALVALQAAGDDWLIPNVPAHSAVDRPTDGSVETAYVQAVIDDLIARHGIDPDRLVMAGFSAGGMLSWEIACRMGGRFAAVVPVAGTFWAPVPAGCDGAATSLVHIHGTADAIVPLEGRAIAETRQGSVERALAMYAEHGGFGRPRPAALAGLDCSLAENAAGAALMDCRHGGGHAFSAAWIGAALAWLLP